MKILKAKRILPVTGPPVNNGAIAIDDGLIAAVGSANAVTRKYPSSRIIDLGPLLLMPGLVNTHTHLELSHLHGRIGEHHDFFGWIDELIRLRRSVGARGMKKAVKDAIMQAVSTGTTCIGDISATGSAIPALKSSGLRALVFLETIGLDPVKADEAVDSLRTRLSAAAKLPGRIAVGVSPHATYSVSRKLYSKLRTIISDSGLSFAVHLSETIDEINHFKGIKSGMDGYISGVGWKDHEPNRGHSPLGFLKDMGLVEGLLAVHAVHLTKRDMRLMAKSGVSVSHCPRSNHMLNTGTAPVSELAELGVNVSIGTDSLASNIDLDMWEEMRFAYLVNRLGAEQVIRMGTINGARALRMDAVTGSIEPGKDADIIAVETPAASGRDPYRSLLYNTGRGDVKLSMVQGRTIYISEDIKGENGL